VAAIVITYPRHQKWPRYTIDFGRKYTVSNPRRHRCFYSMLWELQTLCIL